MNKLLPYILSILLGLMMPAGAFGQTKHYKYVDTVNMHPDRTVLIWCNGKKITYRNNSVNIDKVNVVNNYGTNLTIDNVHKVIHRKKQSK